MTLKEIFVGEAATLIGPASTRRTSTLDHPVAQDPS